MPEFIDVSQLAKAKLLISCCFVASQSSTLQQVRFEQTVNIDRAFVVFLIGDTWDESAHLGALPVGKCASVRAPTLQVTDNADSLPAQVYYTKPTYLMLVTVAPRCQGDK